MHRLLLAIFFFALCDQALAGDHWREELESQFAREEQQSKDFVRSTFPPPAHYEPRIESPHLYQRQDLNTGHLSYEYLQRMD